MAFPACMTAQKKIGDTVLPKNDDVLIYDLPFDLTFLKTLEAVQMLRDWNLESTQKERGIIQVLNTDYLTLSQADERHITFIVKRINRTKTSVEIAPDDQAVLGGKELLEKISEVLSYQF